MRDYVFPMFRANTVYEGQYLLGTSIARPLIAKKQIEIAHKVGADAVCHGATGKGNDQVRFELGYYALDPNIKIIAPWRALELQGPRGAPELRARAPDHHHQGQGRRGAVSRSTPTCCTPPRKAKCWRIPARKRRPWSISAPSRRWKRRTSRPRSAIGFKKGDAVSLNGKAMSPATLLAALNKLGHDNGIGRIDLVENRFVGMKSRGVYETPGGTILLAAHRAMESITLDRGAGHLKDELMPRYAELIYNGFWFAPEREMLQAAIDKSQELVEGEVRLKLYKGNVIVTGRESPASLYSSTLVTFEDDKGAYDQKDAEGFIKLNALRLRTLAQRKRKLKLD